MMNNLTTQEAADILGVTVRTVRRAIKRGQLKATKRGRDWFIEAESLKNYTFSKGGKPTHYRYKDKS